MLTDKKIRVNTVVPGLVKTELWDKQGHSKEAQEKIFADGAKNLSVGFVAGPEDIAEAYLYAVRADYANGSIIDIGELNIVHDKQGKFTDEIPSRWRCTALICRT